VRDLSVPERMRGLRGVVVTGISANGLAAGKLLAGDLIIAVQNSPISGASEFFLHLAASAAVQETAIQLLRDGQSMRVTLPAMPRRE
jgi:S1-C subfamily serine protease